jgi:hypothetical protein
VLTKKTPDTPVHFIGFSGNEIQSGGIVRERAKMFFFWKKTQPD